jgi:hypothetical protein
MVPPPPENLPPEPEHDDHYLPDDLWAKVCADAEKIRAESPESETD